MPSTKHTHMHPILNTHYLHLNQFTTHTHTHTQLKHPLYIHTKGKERETQHAARKFAARRWRLQRRRRGPQRRSTDRGSRREGCGCVRAGRRRSTATHRGEKCHPTHNIHIHLDIITYVSQTIINARTKCTVRGEHSHRETFSAPMKALAEGAEAAEDVDG